MFRDNRHLRLSGIGTYKLCTQEISTANTQSTANLRVTQVPAVTPPAQRPE